VKDHKDHVPKCKECGKDMKPHGMFFDESYNEHYYRSESIAEFYEDCDAMIVVGTTLLTSMAKKMVVMTLEREVPVIEINYEPCLQVGHTYQVIGKSDDTLPAMFSAYYKALGINHVNQEKYAAHFKPGNEESKQSLPKESQNWKKPVAPVSKEPAVKPVTMPKPVSKPAPKVVNTAPKAPIAKVTAAKPVTKPAPKK
jgi:hypothetical protein